MRLLEYESAIKSRVKRDKNDPEIYNLLQKMIFIFLKRKRACHNEKDQEDVSFTIASDLYMRIIDGEEFSYYLGYLDKVYHEYVGRFYDCYKSQVQLDPSIDVNHEILGNPSVYDYCKLNNKIYLKEIYRVVDELMDESCKYKRKSKDYINIKLSLVLSLIRGEIVSFHLNQEQLFYLRLLVVRFYSKVKEEGLDTDGNFCLGE